jgi:hypothetical protein
MRGVAVPVALPVAAAILALALLHPACFSSPTQPASCIPNELPPAAVSFTWPCWVTLTSQTITGPCAVCGLAGEGANCSIEMPGPDTLQVVGTGGGTCTVTLGFSNGTKYTQSFHNSVGTIDGVCDNLVSSASTFYAPVACDEDGAASCDCAGGAEAGADATEESVSDATWEAAEGGAVIGVDAARDAVNE